MKRLHELTAVLLLTRKGTNRLINNNNQYYHYNNNLFKPSRSRTQLNPCTPIKQFARYNSTLTTTTTTTTTNENPTPTPPQQHVSTFKLSFPVHPKVKIVPVMDDPNLEYPPPYQRPPPPKEFSMLDFIKEVAENRVEDAENSLKTQKNIVNKYGAFYHLPLLAAVQYGSFESVKLLLQYKAKVNIQQVATKNTALHYVITAVAHQRVTQLNIATALLEYGANPNLINSVLLTPLHLVVLRGNIDLLKLIVEKSKVPIDFRIKDPLGRKAQEIAVYKERLDMSDYLEKKEEEQKEQRQRKRQRLLSAAE